MGLSLGKTFNRSYNLRVPFLDGYYNIGAFFNKRSPFLLFRVDPSFNDNITSHGVKINMFKNLESSRFSETFLVLHNFRKATLDIINQFQEIKSSYHFDVNFIFNETLKLSKIEIEDRVLFDTLTLYGFTLSSYDNEFIFVIAERQSIIKKLNKKVVRTTGIQIATSRALSLLNDFYSESKKSGRAGMEKVVLVPSNEKKILNLDDEDG